MNRITKEQIGLDEVFDQINNQTNPRITDYVKHLIFYSYPDEFCSVSWNVYNEIRQQVLALNH